LLSPLHEQGGSSIRSGELRFLTFFLGASKLSQVIRNWY